MFRIAFNPALPLIATSAFPDGTVASGEVFDWRAKGIAEIDAFAMFRSGLLTHGQPSATPAPLVTASADELTESELERLTAPTPIAKIAVGPSADQPRKRRR